MGGVLARAQQDKREKYDERVQRLGGTFTPFAASVYGTLAPESERVVLTLVKKLTKEKKIAGRRRFGVGQVRKKEVNAPGNVY